MRAVIQRVERASVSVEGEIRGQIGAGFLVLIGVEEGDGDADFRYIAEKVPNLRVFEDEQGEELEVEDILPYSLEEPHIDLEDEDYGIWYLDIQEHPERYVGKTITFKAQAMTGMRLPKGTFVPGRNAMTCCVEDIRFFGFLCKYEKARSLKKGEWVTVTAVIRWENASVYDGEGVVLYATSVEKAQRPEDPLVYFR